LYKKIESKLTTVRNPNFDVDLVLYLIRAVVYNDPTKNYRSKGKREGWIGLPKSKSLFFAKEGNGFPIGNLTSQLFGNIYLDEFDHFAREEIGVQFYGRYVDDMVFVHRDKEFLKSVILKVKNYLHNELGLEVHPKKIYLQHYVKGVGFLGTFIKPWRIYIGKKTKENFYVKIREWNEFVKNNGLPGEKDASRLIACVNSYLGIMKHYNTSILRKKILSGFCGEILKGILFYENFTKIGLARASISKNICK
jgi:hypothetical protein